MAETIALPLLIACNADTRCKLLPGLSNRHGNPEKLFPKMTDRQIREEG